MKMLGLFTLVMILAISGCTGSVEVRSLHRTTEQQAMLCAQQPYDTYNIIYEQATPPPEEGRAMIVGTMNDDAPWDSAAYCVADAGDQNPIVCNIGSLSDETSRLIMFGEGQDVFGGLKTWTNPEKYIKASKTSCGLLTGQLTTCQHHEVMGYATSNPEDCAGDLSGPHDYLDSTYNYTLILRSQ